MGKERTSIPKVIKEKVLGEFNHKCAICGSERPQLHHIDENPSNNELLNLIPLCPNCHLTDQHNPTTVIPLHKLKLFREHKDPAILSPKFHPLYKRITYLFEISDTSPDEFLQNSSVELVNFISFFNMGGFYKEELTKLIRCKPRSYHNGSPYLAEKGYIDEYRDQLLNNREKALELIVELLRYQDWL